MPSSKRLPAGFVLWLRSCGKVDVTKGTIWREPCRQVWGDAPPLAHHQLVQPARHQCM
jgi:hypothetical protein